MFYKKLLNLIYLDNTHALIGQNPMYYCTGKLPLPDIAALRTTTRMDEELTFRDWSTARNKAPLIIIFNKIY